MSALTSPEGRHQDLPEQDSLELPVIQHTGRPLPAPAPEPSTFRLIATLGIAGFLSGLSLVLVYMATEPAIERNRIRAIERAVFQVLPEATSFRVLYEEGGEVVIQQDSSQGMPRGPVVYAGFDPSGKAVGYAIPGSGPGFQDTLGILIGWDSERERVVGMSVLETRETPGLGDKIITDKNFTDSFLDLSLEPKAVLVDPGMRSKENEVDGISGATISAVAIVNIVNQAVSSWKDRLPDPSELSNLEEGFPSGDEQIEEGDTESLELLRNGAMEGTEQ